MKANKCPAGMGDIESLIKYKIIDGSRWYPVSVDQYRQDLSLGLFETLNSHFRNNMCYSLQYLEYLELQVRELNLSSVITAMIYKNFIITAASIIELVFYHLAKVNGKIKVRNYKEVDRQFIKKPNNIIVPSQANKFLLISYEPLPKEVEDNVRFEQLISIVRDNNLLQDINLKLNNDYVKLLRKLRNKVHLTTPANPYETDFMTFSFKDYIKAKLFLLMVLTDCQFGKDKQIIFPRMIQAVKSQISEFKQNRKTSYLWIL